MARKIRKVNTGTGEYYIYDFVDLMGKRKRLYAKSEGELKDKINNAEKEKVVTHNAYKPKSNKLYEYAVYYFKTLVGTIDARLLNRLIRTFGNIVKGSSIDKEISSISVEEINDFFKNIALRCAADTTKSVYEALEKIFTLASLEGIISSNLFEEVEPIEYKEQPNVHFLLDPVKFEELLTLFIKDNCIRYGKNELLLVFSMLTGFKLSSFRNLKNRDISLEEGTMKLKDRTVKLPEEALVWLTEKKTQGQLLCTEPDSIVFTNSNNRFPTIQSVIYTLERAAISNGFQNGISSAILHKSYVLYQISKGRNPEELATYLGYPNTLSIAKILDEKNTLDLLF